jgi:diaminopimelate decarboxylase
VRLLVLPQTAKINEKDHLEIGGCDTVELAKEFGTPLFVMDETTIRSNCRQYLAAFKEKSKQSEVIYAGKAFISLAMCQLIDQEGLSLDVSSGGELFIAKKAGVPAERIYLHGNNKTKKELELAMEYGVGRIVADSFNELDLLRDLAASKGIKPKILLRITPGIEAHTHEYIQTGGADSKFGFGLSGGAAMEAVKQVLSMDEEIQLVGIHAHIGSQIFALHSYSKAIEIIMEFIKEVLDETGFRVAEFNAGGGLGIKYKAKDEPSTIEEYAEVIAGGVEKEAKKLGLEVPKIMIEPGRSIVGSSGVTLYTIGTIKKIPGIRTYISVDGGMSDNLRPMLYKSAYEAIVANRASREKTEKVTIAGKHCESGDILVKNARIPAPEIGDILCTPATGAYGYVMANNYNKATKPAVVLVKDGESKTIIRRETYEDLLLLERPLR